MEFKAHFSKKFVFSINDGTNYVKIFQLLFGKDGSFYVNLPYYRNTEGIVSVANYPKQKIGNIDISLELGGKTTRSLVKYSHHPNGKASFSQTRKVRPDITKSSIPLQKLTGHVFTIMLQGLPFFSSKDTKKDNNPPSEKRTNLNFDFSSQPPKAYKILGMCYKPDELLKRLAGSGPESAMGPLISIQKPNGSKINGFLVSSPKNYAFNPRVFIIYAEAIPIFNSDEETTLTFLGGFDPLSAASDEEQDTNFLALIYPIDNIESLVKKIGSIDIRSF